MRDNINLDLEKMVCGGMDRIKLTPNIHNKFSIYFVWTEAEARSKISGVGKSFNFLRMSEYLLI